jgi:ATP phosphoribosyltransferase
MMIKVALPNKGVLYQPSIDLLQASGFDIEKPTKSLYYIDSKNEIEFYFLRASDIPMYLSNKIIDIGFTGVDLHVEKNGLAKKVFDLPFGSSKLCVASNNKDLVSLRDISNLRLATSFPNIVRNHFSEKNIDIIKLDGAVEISISLGLADCIVDVVETGASLRAAGLEIISEPIFRSNAAVYSIHEHKSNHRIDKFLQRVQGRLIASEYNMIEYDVLSETLDSACRLTPGIESPTISQLKSNNWFSVKSMVKKQDAQEIMDQLHAIGCKAILLTNIEMARI